MLRFPLWTGILPLLALLATSTGFNPSPSESSRFTNTAPELVTPSVQLTPFASGLDRPTEIASTGIPGDGRLFVLERAGIIRVVNPSGTVLSTPFLNINARVGSGGSEQGLLGMAFDPSYAQNGYFYVNYTDTSGDTVIARFQVRQDNPDRADPDSESILLAVDQPFANHNAGDLAFGPDGYLYIPLGDGGSGGDPGDRAQNRNTLLGKILRINVYNPPNEPPQVNDQIYIPFITGPRVPYSIPADNPFVDDPGSRPEIWSLGLRNPWRISFDRVTGELFIGDVGQNIWEEIDSQPADSAGGENYGWRCYEGNHPYDQRGCSAASDYVFPVAEYAHTSNGCSVTGGFVYRGSQYPSLAGRYFYADYCSGNFWRLDPDGSGGWTVQSLGNLGAGNPSTFGEGVDGELYVAGYGDGVIYQITD